VPLVGASEVDLTPFEIDGLADPQAIASHDQDQRRVALARALRAALINRASSDSVKYWRRLLPRITPFLR
jgi:hypothetical protein